MERATIASFGDVRGHSHGMQRFTRPYSVELTPEQYALLREEEQLKLAEVAIKFVNPENQRELLFLTFYVSADERADRVRIDEQNKRAYAEREQQERESKRLRLLQLAQGPKKTGRDSWFFVKHYDPRLEDRLVILLFGMYQVFRDGTDLKFVLKQTCGNGSFEDYDEQQFGTIEISFPESSISVGYSDFVNLTPDLIQEKLT
jgi:hypothetical protein